MSNMLRSIRRAAGYKTGSRGKGRRVPQGMGEAKRLFEKNKMVRELHERDAIRLLPVSIFLRSPVRKPREPMHVYRRSMRNHNRALAVRLQYGPDAHLHLNKETLTIIW